MIYINIASIPERLDCLTDTIESLYNQADEINLYLNNYKENPFKGDKKINVVLGDNSKGDAGKAFFAEYVSGFYFMVDDDLIFPADYVSNTLKNMYKRDAVSYHGRTITEKKPVSSYYRAEAIKYRCLGTVLDDSFVQVAGTGCACFHTNDIKIKWKNIRHRNMFDLVFSAMVKRQRKETTVLKHESGWIKYNNRMLNKKTIYDEFCRNDKKQTDFFNQNFV